MRSKYRPQLLALWLIACKRENAVRYESNKRFKFYTELPFSDLQRHLSGGTNFELDAPLYAALEMRKGRLRVVTTKKQVLVRSASLHDGTSFE